MHTLFQKYISAFTINGKYLKPLKLKLINIYDALTQSEGDNLNAVKGRVTDLNNKIETLEERSALGEIPQDVFQKYSFKYKSERAALEDKLPKYPIETSNLEEYFQEACEFASSLSEIWAEGTYRIREILQYLVFPEGVFFDREKDTLRTEKVNEIFDRIHIFTNEICGGGKK